MAVMTPSITVLKPQVQTRTPESRTKPSEKDMNSELLDNFLKSCRGTPFPHLAPPENPVRLTAIDVTIINLPQQIIKRILRNLLTSPHPLILHPDPITTTKQSYRTHVEPDVLRVCKVFYNIGVPILYGENTLTASSPATSVDFDAHLLSLPGGKRQMIRDVVLEIDWADKLWAKLPLVARALGELKGLRRLELFFVVERERRMMERETETGRMVCIERDMDLDIRLMYDQTSPSEKDWTVRHQCGSGADWRGKREGILADVMLKAEMKMLEDLVGGIKGLRRFRLVGYRDRVFAGWLEERVRVGRRH